MRKVYIVDGARTPFLKARNAPGPFSASDMATAAGSALLSRQNFLPDQLDEVILGCASPSTDEVNIGRVVALRLGCGHKVPGWTVMRNCASGLQALDSAMTNIETERADLVLAGGADALSRAPLLFSDTFVRWLSGWASAKSTGQKIAALRKFRLRHLKPVMGIMKGLTDPVVGQLMGQTAENLAHRFDITREQMDEYSVRSHQRSAAALKAGFLHEIVPLVDRDGKVYQEDDGVRHDSSMANLAKLKPFFDRKYGRVTPGNSSQITDGAAWLLLASEKAVEKYDLKPIACIKDRQWAGLAPEIMGLGPVHASTPILQRQQLSLDDIERMEINEAFAAQVLGCLRAWEEDKYCQEHLGLSQAFGSIDPDRLNVDGGAVAMGHPVGASGARIVLHLVHTLRRDNLKTGMASICIGGGQGGAMLIEAM